MQTKIFRVILFLVFIGTKTTSFGQTPKIGENLFNNPSIFEGQKADINSSLTKMQNCMKIYYFKDKKKYENTCAPILSEDKKTMTDFIQIKISDNSILVILVDAHCIPPPDILLKQQSYNGSLVACCSYFVKYGEIDKSTIKYCWLNKKRVYPENNEFTEELWISTIMFIKITERQYFQSITIKGIPEIKLTQWAPLFVINFYRQTLKQDVCQIRRTGYNSG